MEYMPQVRVSKEDLLKLSDLAGNMSLMEYMSKIIHEHVAAQQSGEPCPSCKQNDRRECMHGVFCGYCQSVKV